MAHGRILREMCRRQIVMPPVMARMSEEQVEAILGGAPGGVAGITAGYEDRWLSGCAVGIGELVEGNWGAVEGVGQHHPVVEALIDGDLQAIEVLGREAGQRAVFWL
jgi:hypothetical protein